MFLHRLIEAHWRKPNPYLTWFLAPLSRLFAFMVNKRRQKYLSGSLKSETLSCPVVVVGNLHAGGTGKTPITSALISALQARGVKVGVISRGYGRTLKDIHILHSGSYATQAGDEPLMLFRQTGVPIAVGANRIQAGKALLAANPDIQLILADDGLQHYAMAREIEICVFPRADLAKTHLDVLPNGILREPLSRLQTVDFIVISNGEESNRTQAVQQFSLPENIKVFYSQTQTALPYRFTKPNEIWHSGCLKTGQTCAAIAAIAKPERFFNTLKNMGFALQETRTLPDHRPISLADLPQADVVFITEKDAVKLPKNAPNHIWVLPIKAHIEPDLAQEILAKLNIQAA